MSDYPAAHSMDTDWYAVDRDGRVARCDSGEVGPVPAGAPAVDWSTIAEDFGVLRVVRALRGGPLDEQVVIANMFAASTDEHERALLAQIARGDEHARAIYADLREARGEPRAGWSPRERAVYVVGEDFARIPYDAMPERWRGVMVFTSAAHREALRAEATMTSARDVDPRMGVRDAIFVGFMNRITFERLWMRGAIALVCVLDEPAPREVGLFEYQHDWGYGPYQRDGVPAAPVSLADLPAPLRERLGRLRLPVDFEADAAFDPADHVPCLRHGEDS